MSMLSSEQLHASAVSIGGRAVMLMGPSGAGKSDLALRLIDRGGQLISDDITIVRRVEGSLRVTAPDRLRGKLEVRGLGIFDLASVSDVPLALMIDLAAEVARFPLEDGKRMVAGVEIPVIALHALEGSAPIKVEMALKRVIS